MVRSIHSLLVLPAIAHEQGSLLQATHTVRNLNAFKVATEDRGDALAELEGQVNVVMNAVPGAKHGSSKQELDFKAIYDILDKFNKTINVEHGMDQQSVTDAVKEGTSCNDEFDSDKTTLDGVAKNTKDGLEPTHSTCRSDQAKRLSSQKAAQTALKNYVASLTVDCKLPTDPTVESSSSWFAGIKEFVSTTESTLATKEKAVTDAKSVHEQKKGSCDAAQDNFESAFCTWRSQVHMTCGKYDLCYESAQSAYAKVVAASAAKQQVRHQELKSIAQIRCHLDHILMNSTAPADCSKVVDLSTQTLPVTSFPTNETCNQVQNYPGTNGFKYDNTVVGAKTPMACSALGEWSHKTTTTMSWVGCYVDDENRDLKQGPNAYGYSTATCAKACSGYKYMSLPDTGQCACGNAYATSAQYTKKPDKECGSICSGESSLSPTRLCGGSWRNAIYSFTAAPKLVQVPAFNGLQTTKCDSRLNALQKGVIDALPEIDFADTTGTSPKRPLAMKVTIGEVTDYFKPIEGASFKDMVLSLNKHQWSSDGSSWRIPAYSPPAAGGDGAGGSADGWPKKNVAGDGRRFLSFWGVGGNSPTVCGCCHETLDGPYQWQRAHKMEFVMK